MSQNETLSWLFQRRGYSVRRASAIKARSLRTAHQFLAILWWRKVDLLVIAVFSGPSFWIAEFATRLGRLTGKRMVLFLHGGSLPEFGPKHRRWVTAVMDRADLVLAPSDFLTEPFRSWGVDVRVIPNVLAIERYEYRKRDVARPALLWMRTFHEHYDPLMAVRVLHRVASVYPDATMTMAGADQGLFDETVAEAERLGVADRITFPGYMDAEAKADAFASHDIFLNTNIVDNMPVSVLEAAASGLVPVATEVGGIPALLTDGVDSVLVPARHDEAMAAAAIDLLESPQRYAAISERARELAERSAWPAVLEKWEAEIELLLPECRLPSPDQP